MIKYRETPGYYKKISDTERIEEIAKCRLSYVALFSLMSPIVGYRYTGRFKTVGCFLSIAIVGYLFLQKLFLNSNFSSYITKFTLGIFIATAASTDNLRAVAIARKQLQLQSPKPIQKSLYRGITIGKSNHRLSNQLSNQLSN